MVDEQSSTLPVIIFAVAIALLFLRAKTNPKERSPQTDSTTQTASTPFTQPRAVQMMPPLSEESQNKVREEAMKLATESLERKREKIDNMFKMRIALDQLEIKGRRVLQEAILERELQQMVLEQAARPYMYPAAMPLTSHAPQQLVGTPEAYQTQEVPVPRAAIQGQIYQIPETRVPEVATTARIYELPGDVEDAATQVALRNFQPEEEEETRERWTNPYPLHERIRDWQRGVQEHESDSRSNTPRTSSFHRRKPLC